jgi:hypothetical protein
VPHCSVAVTRSLVFANTGSPGALASAFDWIYDRAPVAPTQRHDMDSVTALLEGAGANPDTAAQTVRALAAAGLSFAEARAWLCHPTRAYPVLIGEVEIAGIAEPQRQTPIYAIEDGHEQHVLAAAEQFKAASREERAISRSLGCDIDDTRRLTGRVPTRAAAIARLVELLRNRLRKPEHVADVAQTRLPSHDGQRMVDLILEGREQDVLADLASGRIDPHALLEDGELELWGW